MNKKNAENKDYVLEDECFKLSRQNAELLDFVYLAASSIRPDGTYNNCREALESKAKQILNNLNL